MTRTSSDSPRVVALVSTIPARKASCERLLQELAAQSRPPDVVLLRLDGYGGASAPCCSLRCVAEIRTPAPSGAGGRWLVAVTVLSPDDVIVCVDDDAVLAEAPLFVETLARAARGDAAATMGRTSAGKFAPPVGSSLGELVYGCGLGLAVRARHLAGLGELAAEVVACGGPDALGLLGDDDALVSAHLWTSGVKIVHAPAGNVYAAAGTRATSQSHARAAHGEAPNMQKNAIKKITGWPFTLK